jgi:hypothetical protein
MGPFFPDSEASQGNWFFTEKANLVPACGKCNQSKGNKDWETWIRSSAPLSPHKRGVPNLEARIQVLQRFATQFRRHKIDLSEIRKSEEWRQYEALREEIVQKLRDGDAIAKLISKMILDASGAKTRMAEPVISLGKDKDE